MNVCEKAYFLKFRVTEPRGKNKLEKRNIKVMMNGTKCQKGIQKLNEGISFTQEIGQLFLGGEEKGMAEFEGN